VRRLAAGDGAASRSHALSAPFPAATIWNQAVIEQADLELANEQLALAAASIAGTERERRAE